MFLSVVLMFIHLGNTMEYKTFEVQFFAKRLMFSVCMQAIGLQ